MNIPGYDAWKMTTPWDDVNEIGTEDGQPCMRYDELDEDAPRGYRPKPCKGVMVHHDDGISCDACGVWV